MIRFCPQNENVLNQIADLCTRLDAHFARFKDKVPQMTGADFVEQNRLLAECGIAHAKLREGLQLEDDSFTLKLDSAETAFKASKASAERRFVEERTRLETQLDTKLKQYSNQLDANFNQMSQSVDQFSAKFASFKVTPITVTAPSQFRNANMVRSGPTIGLSEARTRVNNLMLERDLTNLVMTKTGLWIFTGCTVLGFVLFSDTLVGAIFWGLIFAGAIFGMLALLSSRARESLKAFNGAVSDELLGYLQRHDHETETARRALTTALQPLKTHCDSQIIQFEREWTATRSRILHDRDQTLREYVARVGRTDVGLLSRLKRCEKLVADWTSSHLQLAAGIEQKQQNGWAGGASFPDFAPQLIRLGDLSIASVNRGPN